MPKRMLHDGVLTSEKIEAVGDSAEALYYRLIVSADDEGRMDARPAFVASTCYPLRRSLAASEVARMLDLLTSEELIVWYEVDGKPYLEIAGWTTKQTLRRVRPSQYPAPDDGMVVLPAKDLAEAVAVEALQSAGRFPQTAEKCAQPAADDGDSQPTAEIRAPEVEVEDFEVEEPEVKTIALVPRARRRDPLWDALTDEFGEPQTTTEKSLRGKTVRSLKEAKATADDVHHRAAEHRRRWPNVDCTQTSLEKHWTHLGRDGPRPKVAEPKGFESLREIRRQEHALRGVGTDRSGTAGSFPPPGDTA